MCFNNILIINYNKGKLSIGNILIHNLTIRYIFNNLINVYSSFVLAGEEDYQEYKRKKYFFIKGLVLELKRL